MEFKKGSRRFVFIFPRSGIVIKFPFVRLFVVAGSILGHIAHRRFKFILEEARISPNNSVVLGYSAYLFGGVLDNWREFRFYIKTRHPFLQPTYFSFFGLFNIQACGEKCLLKKSDLWCQLYVLTNGKAWDDGHHFANPQNFCLKNGELRIIDYGNPRTHSVITEFGKKIVRFFRLDYDWEKVKEKMKEPFLEPKDKCPLCKAELSFMSWCCNCRIKIT